MIKKRITGAKNVVSKSRSSSGASNAPSKAFLATPAPKRPVGTKSSKNAGTEQFPLTQNSPKLAFRSLGRNASLVAKLEIPKSSEGATEGIPQPQPIKLEDFLQGEEVRPAWERTYGRLMRRPQPKGGPDADGDAGIAEGPPAVGAGLHQATDGNLYPWNSLAWIVARDGNGRLWGGTGWYLENRLILTAGHVVYTRGPAGSAFMSQVAIFPRHVGDPNAEGFVLPANCLRASQRWKTEGAPEADYGAIVIPPTHPANESSFVVVSTPARPVIVAGYPGDGSVPKGTLWYGSGELQPSGNPTHDPDQWFYAIPTHEGQSGGPVFFLTEPSGDAFVIGIHNYGDSPWNFATRFTDTVMQEIQTWRA